MKLQLFIFPFAALVHWIAPPLFELPFMKLIFFNVTPVPVTLIILDSPCASNVALFVPIIVNCLLIVICVPDPL